MQMQPQARSDRSANAWLPLSKPISRALSSNSTLRWANPVDTLGRLNLLASNYIGLFHFLAELLPTECLLGYIGMFRTVHGAGGIAAMLCSTDLQTNLRCLHFCPDHSSPFC